MHRFSTFFTFFFLALLCIYNSSFASENEIQNVTLLKVNKISSLTIESSINPATLSYLKNALNKAKKRKVDLHVITLNTPGGLVSTTKEILTLFGESDIPIIIWIRPAGASATSAGAIIASGAHLLYMSEGTNIGAATPIQMGKDIDSKSDMRKKAVNDLVALVKSLSEARERNPAPFAQMIKSATSFSSKKALELKLIDGMANSRNTLLKSINGKVISIKGNKIKLQMTAPKWQEYKMDLGQKLLNIFANPNTAYILFLIGAALIYLEFQAPGGFIAGGLGALSLVLASIGLQVLPVNAGAFGLIIVSFILFIMEIFITSYGILSVAGLGSLMAGSLFLFRTDDAYLDFSTSLVLSAVFAIGSFLGIIFYLFIKDQKNIGKEKFNEQVGQQVKIIQKIQSTEENINMYQVKVGGEIWNARSKRRLTNGEMAKVISRDEHSIILTLE